MYVGSNQFFRILGDAGSSEIVRFNDDLSTTFAGSVIFSTGGSASNNSIYHHPSNNWMYVQGGTAGLGLKGKNSDDSTIYLNNSSQNITLNTNNVARLTLTNSSATFSGDVIAESSVNLPNGSAASPSLSFTSDGNTGFYRAAEDNRCFIKWKCRNDYWFWY